MHKRDHLRLATFLANRLDNQFRIAGFRFGLSAIFDLIPGIGDTIDFILSMYIIVVAIELGVPFPQVIKMITNIVTNYLIGLVPVIGDVIYILRKVNLKNLEIIKKYTSENIVEGKLAYQ